MDYKSIHQALIDEGLNWSIAAEAMGITRQHLLNVAARRVASAQVAKQLAALVHRPIEEIFPDIPAYQEPDRKEVRRALVEQARQRLAAAG